MVAARIIGAVQRFNPKDVLVSLVLTRQFTFLMPIYLN
jgi:hypothetical protein